MTSQLEAIERARKRERSETIDLKTIVKRTKLKASSFLLVTYIQLRAGFEAQLQL